MNAHANLMQDMTYYRTDNLIQKTASRVRYPCQTSVTSCLLAHIMLTAVESSDQWKVRKGDITVFGHDSQTMRHQQDAIRVCSYVKSYVVAAIHIFHSDNAILQLNNRHGVHFLGANAMLPELFEEFMVLSP